MIPAPVGVEVNVNQTELYPQLTIPINRQDIIQSLIGSGIYRNDPSPI